MKYALGRDKHDLFYLILVGLMALSSQVLAGEKPLVIPFELPTELAVVLERPAWLKVGYSASPDGELLFEEGYEKVWFSDDKAYLFLGSCGENLPAVVTERATVFVRFSHNDQPLHNEGIELHPRRQAVVVSGKQSNMLQALALPLAGIDANYLSKVANYLAANLPSLDVEASSYNVSGVGMVIDSSGHWVGDASGLQGPQGDQGLQGLPGIAGVQGLQGEAGEEGATGAQGVQGETGASPFDLQGNDAVYTQGRVGIGTSTPSETLEVDGTVKATRFEGDGSGLTGIAGLGSVVHPDYFTPSKLTGGEGAQANPSQWAALNSGSFRMLFDGNAHDVVVNFSSSISMSDVAALLQAGIREVSGGLETVLWDSNHFIFVSGDHSIASTVGFASPHSSATGIDISGVGADNWLDADAATAVVTPALIDLAFYQGQVPVITSAGTIDARFVASAKSLGPDSQTLDFLLTPLEAMRGLVGGSTSQTRFQLSASTTTATESAYWPSFGSLGDGNMVVVETSISLSNVVHSFDRAGIALGRSSLPRAVDQGLDSTSNYGEIGILAATQNMWTCYMKNGTGPAQRVHIPRPAGISRIRIEKDGEFSRIFVNGALMASFTNGPSSLSLVSLAATDSSSGSMTASVYGNVLLRFSSQ